MQVRIQFIKETVQPPYTRKSDHGKEQVGDKVPAQGNKRQHGGNTGYHIVVLRPEIPLVIRVPEQSLVKVGAGKVEPPQVIAVFEDEVVNIHPFGIIQYGGVANGNIGIEKCERDHREHFDPECLLMIEFQQRVIYLLSPGTEKEIKKSDINRKQYKVE
jgi:hypothetical protein